MRDDEREAAEERRRIIRRAGLYTWGLFAVTMFIALGGAALIALLMRVPGVSFVKRWLVISALVLVPASILYLIQRYRESRRAARGPDSGG
ncbi:MAG: hypothetical protein GX539_00195 [Candidatus Cloacimonetes bacterium]|jgi:hypothetical protein|nr:hypothetical protein [Candidatus Cloacimonadota bacterium]